MTGATFAGEKTTLLNSGYEMPLVGLGTWQGQPGTKDALELKNTIIHALKSGYRSIDTAGHYNVEEVVGEAIRESGVPRGEIFLTTKLQNDYHDAVEEGFLGSLDRLNVEYIDLYLMHWPGSFTRGMVKAIKTPTPSETWLSMEALLKKYPTKLRSIGVSNFTKKTMDPLLEVATITPAVNQVELTPCLPEFELVDYMSSKGIHTTAYSPLARQNPAIFTHKIITDLAKELDVAPVSSHSCLDGVSRNISNTEIYEPH